MNSWWYAWDAELSESACDELRMLITQVDTKLGEVGHDNTSLNKKIRSSEIVGIDYNNPYSDFINSLVYKYIVMANRESFGFNLNGMYEFQLGKYKSGDFYTEHMDCNLLNNASQRKLSVTVQLSHSKEYEGGDFDFTKDIVIPAPLKQEFLELEDELQRMIFIEQFLDSIINNSDKSTKKLNFKDKILN